LANRRFAPRAVRRPTFWEGGSIFHNNATGVTVASVLVPEASLENVPNSTLVRIRGQVMVAITSGTVGANVLCVMGIKLATTVAVAGGSVERPFTDVGSDWIWWSVVALSVQNTIGIEQPHGSVIMSKYVDIDSKAMRKVGLNQDLVFVTQNVVVAGTAAFEVVGAGRVLFKR